MQSERGFPVHIFRQQALGNGIVQVYWIRSDINPDFPYLSVWVEVEKGGIRFFSKEIRLQTVDLKDLFVVGSRNNTAEYTSVR